MESVKLDGKPVSREDVKSWLKSKKVTLWSDWCVNDPKRMELAVDWFMGEMAALSATVPGPPKKVASKGKKKANAKRAAASRT